MAVTVNIGGLDDAVRKLNLLPNRIGSNAVRRSLRKGANVIRDAARQNAKRLDDPETREQVWKNIVVQGAGKQRERRAGGPMMRVGVLGGAKQKKRGKGSYETGGSSTNPGGDTFYFRFLEFGTSRMRAQPFLRPAMSESWQEAGNTVASDLAIQIDNELQKLR